MELINVFIENHSGNEENVDEINSNVLNELLKK